MLPTVIPVTRNRLASKQAPEDLVRVVHLYFQRGLKQPEIARRMGVTKMTVSRMLKRAEAMGLVQIQVRLPVANDPLLEQALKRRLGLEQVFVVKTPEESRDAAGRLASLAVGAAFMLDAEMTDGMTLGVAVGRTLGYVVAKIQMRQLTGASVVQLTGGFDIASFQNPYNLLQELRQRLGATGHYVTGPAIVEGPEIRRALLEHADRSGVRDLWRTCDLCISGLGSTIQEDAFLRSGLLTSEEHRALIDAGAIGDILGYHFNADGIFLDVLGDRVNSIPLTDAYRLRNLVVIAGGEAKVQPIIAMSKLGLPVTLVTDDVTATAIQHVS